MDKLKEIVKINKALSDITRLRIIALLFKRKKLCVCEIKEVIGLSQPAISSHLKILENLRLIKGFREGKWMNYKIHEELEKEKKQHIKFIISLLKNSTQISDDEEKAKRADRFCLCRTSGKSKTDILQKKI
ncbi:MAG: metalloregulator ArsR/SmtB family transcription factor [Actinomycetota bacterium]|nr:metalloregulator ArsR/SmtB family transcription factor [Actinomycetota bacterium]